MKKLLLTTIVAIATISAITGCKKNQQEQAQSLVRKQLDLLLDDMGSYESVAFSELDSTFTRVEDLEEYKDAEFSMKLIKQSIEIGREYDITLGYEQQAREELALLDSLDLYTRKCKELDSLFVPEFIGWKIYHTFRSNNKNGNKEIFHKVFYLDKGLTTIVGYEDIDIQQ